MAQKAYFVYLNAGNHKGSLILDGEASKFCLSGCRYAFCWTSPVTSTLLEIRAHYQAEIRLLNAKSSTNTVILHQVLQKDIFVYFARKSPLAIYSPENYLAVGRIALPEWDSGRSC